MVLEWIKGTGPRIVGVGGGVWMVFVTCPWFGCVNFDMGYDSAEYKGAGLYVCMPCINDYRSCSDALRSPEYKLYVLAIIVRPY